jgi:hypothetical protein
MYNRVAPIAIDVTTINVPHHLPKTKPERTSKGKTGPKNSIQRIEKIKKIIVRNKKFSILYLKIISLFALINS